MKTTKFKLALMAIVLAFITVSCGNSESLSLICTSARYGNEGWQKCAVPICINQNEIVIGSFPKGVLTIVEKTEQPSDDEREILYKCKNAKGTEFTITLQFTSQSDVLITEESKNGEMTFKCIVANEEPYYHMVDLGLSCKWGMANYSTWSTDIVSDTYGGGKALTYDEAYSLFGEGIQHLPSTKQINELMTKCSWEWIQNPEFDFHKGYLVTGPNGNSIFLPCNDGGDGNFSSAWYWGAEEHDIYLVNALQLNANNQVIYPYEKNLYGNIRLVEEK